MTDRLSDAQLAELATQAAVSQSHLDPADNWATLIDGAWLAMLVAEVQAHRSAKAAEHASAAALAGMMPLGGGEP